MKRPDHAVSVLLGVHLDGPADVAERSPGPDGLDAVPHAFLGDLHQLPAGRVDVADEERSHWCRRGTPPMYVVTSMLMMSPSCSARESGIPWQITSLTLVHTLFGKWL
jgi:hypothetical protein